MKRIYALLLVVVLGVLLFPVRWVSLGASATSGSWLLRSEQQQPQEPAARLVALEELNEVPLAGTEVLQSDPRSWLARLAEGNLRHQEIFPGVDLIFAGSKQKLEAVLIVKASADLKGVHFDFPKAEVVSADAKGTIWVAGPDGDLGLLPARLSRQNQSVKGGFVAAGSRVVLQVEDHDDAQPLLVRFDVAFPTRAVNLLDQILFRVLKHEEQPGAAQSLAPASPASPAAPSAITSVTKTVSPTGNANLGDTLMYSVTIANNGAGPVSGVNFTDTIDPNTTLVGGTLNASPIAQNDTYTGTGNIPIAPANGLLSNDTDPITNTNAGLTVTQVNGSGANVNVATNTTAAGIGGVTGSVTVQSTGSFTYEPPPGYTGNDTFTYQVSEPGGKTDTATVTITISNMVWFISNTGGGLNRGTFTNPFTTIAAFNTANVTGVAPNPQNGHHIVLRGSTYNEADGINLRDNQTLTGGAVAFNTVFTANANSTSAYTTFAASTPGAATINATAGNGVDLALNNALRGFNLGNNPNGAGLNANSLTPVGNLTVANVNKTGTGSAIFISSSAAFGANVNFGTLESTSSLGENIRLSNVTGTLGVTSAGAGLSGSASGFDAIVIDGGSVNFTYPGNVSKTNTGALLTVANGHTGTLTFNTGTLSATAGTGLQFINADGAYNFNGTTTLNGGDAGIDITTGSGGTFSFNSNTSINNPTGIAYREDTSTANVTYNGTITKNNNANNAVDINAKTGGATSFTGAITASTTTANAIDLTNTGGTVNFSGGLNITTTSGVGFNATGAGATVNVCDENPCNPAATGALVNTITSTTGTALNVANTSIGTNRLEFRSISAGTAVLSPVNGIVLNNTGSSGGLSVKGNSAGQCGGAVTVQPVGTANTVTAPSTADCTGGTIQNATGDGIQLINTRDVSLTRMYILNNDGSGILGDDVTNFSLISSFLDNNSDTQTGVEANLRFNELLGTAAITNSTIQGAPEDEIRLTPSSGTLTNLAISGTVIGNDFNNGTAGCVGCDFGNGITISPTMTAAMTVNLTNSVIKDIFAAGVVVNGTDSTPRTFNVSNTTFIEPINDTGAFPHQQFGGVGISLQGSFNADLTFNVSNNTFLGLDSNAINFSIGTTATNDLDVLGTIANNVIGNASTDSGSRDAFGIAMESQGDADTVVFVTSNTTQHTDQGGFFAQSRLDNDADAQTGRFDLIVRDNNFGVMDDNTAFPFFSLNGYHVDARNTSTLCLDSFSNTSSDIGGAGKFSLRNRDTSNFILERFDDGDANFNETITNTATVATFHNGQNDAGSTTTVTLTGAFVGFKEAPDNTCRSTPNVGPSLAAPPIDTDAFSTRAGSESTTKSSSEVDDEKPGTVRLVLPDGMRERRSTTHNLTPNRSRNFGAAFNASANLGEPDNEFALSQTFFYDLMGVKPNWNKYFDSPPSGPSGATAPTPAQVSGVESVSDNNLQETDDLDARLFEQMFESKPHWLNYFSKSRRVKTSNRLSASFADYFKFRPAPTTAHASPEVKLRPQAAAEGGGTSHKTLRQLMRPVLSAFSTAMSYVNPLTLFERPATAAETSRAKAAAEAQATPTLKRNAQDRPTRTTTQEDRTLPERRQPRPPIRVMKSPESGETVMVGPFDIPANESVTIMFSVTVNNPLTTFPLTPPAQVCNQGTVTSTTPAASFMTDGDAGTGGAQPTCTTLNLPELTAVKTNNVSGATQLGNNFTWTTALANSGTAVATFNSGDTIFTDNLPNTNVTYGAASTSGASGITGTGTISCSVVSNDLTCTASGGTVIFGLASTVNVNVTATPSAAGTFGNPRGGGVCKVDPTSTNGVVQESNEGNNACSNSVNVFAPPTIAKTFGASTISPGGVTTMTFTITNPVANPGNLTGVTVTDNFPANLVAGTPALVSMSGCGGGTITDAGGAAFAAGDTGVRVNNATVAVGTPCVVTVNVTSSTPGTYPNTTNAITSTNGGTGPTSNTATLIVASPPTVAKAFSPNPILPGGTSTVTITLSNSNAGLDLTGAMLTDTLPAGVTTVNSTAATTCASGTPSQTGNSVSLSGGTIPQSGSCTLTVNVTAATNGTFTNTIAAGDLTTSNSGPNASPASATLTVADRPTISKAFAPNSILPGGTSTLTITLTNPNSNVPLTLSSPLTDTLPAGVTTVAATHANTCGGTSSQTGGSVTLTGGTIPVSSSCTLSVNVTSTTAGGHINTIAAGALVTNGGTNANPATATLVVGSAPQVDKTFTASAIRTGTTVGLTISITNNNPSLPFNGVDYTDTLPAGLTVSDAPATPACGGTLTVASNVITLTGATIAANGGNCTTTFTATGATVGVKNNTVTVNTTNFGTGFTDMATVTVYDVPTIAKSFTPTSVVFGGTSMMSFVLSNPNSFAGGNLSGVSFTDTLPSGIGVATSGPTSVCGGTLSTTAPNLVNFTGGTLGTSGPGNTCTISVTVMGTQLGMHTNTVTSLTSTQTGTNTVNALATLTVTAAATTTTITSDLPDPSVVGQAVTINYTVAVTPPAMGTPTGNVTVTASTGETCMASVAAGTCNITFTTAGMRTLTAAYAGDSNFGGSISTPATSHNVNPASTSTSITGDLPDPSVVGQAYPVTVTVTVTGLGAGTPTGTITVGDGLNMCTITLPATSCNLTSTTAGAKTLVAMYNSDGNFAGSSDTETHQVNQAATTTTITADTPDPSAPGAAVPINYTVVANAPGGGTPAGNVTVTASTGEMCTGTVAAGTCNITFNTTGMRTLTAVYAGNANYTTSTSATENHNVTACAATLSKPDEAFAANGGSGTFTVTIDPGCNWTVTTSDGWITITAPIGTATGSGAVTYTVASHTGATRRIGTISVAGQTFTVLQGAFFMDVPESHEFYLEIGKLSARGVTSGCGVNLFCPEASLTRQQMTVLILRAKLGSSYMPPPATGTVFADVPSNLLFADFIEDFYNRGITSGCAVGPLRYCPADLVRRDQMAVFVLRAKFVSSYAPPPATGTVFADVPANLQFANFIEDAFNKGISLGCATGPLRYCPATPITRAQTAAFLVRAFNL